MHLFAVSIFCSCSNRCSEHNSNAHTQLAQLQPRWMTGGWERPWPKTQMKKLQSDSFEGSSVKQAPLISTLHSAAAHQFPVLPSAAGYLRAGQIHNLCMAPGTLCWRLNPSGLEWSALMGLLNTKASVMELHCFKPNKTITAEETSFSASF